MAIPSQNVFEFAAMRRACALFGLVALFLQGSSGGHMLLVEHAHCAEHGELVHSEVLHHHAAPGQDDAETLAFESASRRGANEAHGHCALCADRRDSPAGIGAPQRLTMLARVSEPLLAQDAVGISHPRRFRIAPKNSPPA